APRTKTEAAVAEGWAAVLSADSVPVDAGFFDLGGNSLLAVRLVARLRERFGLELPMTLVFERPTVQSIAGEIDRLLVAEIEALSDEDAERLLAETTRG